MIEILKKNGRIEKFNGDKIKNAIRKSAERVCITLSEKEENKLVSNIKSKFKYSEFPITVATIHNNVEIELDRINKRVATSYREYRDNKSGYASMLDKVYNKRQEVNLIGDRSNANADSSLVTTKKAIVYNELNSEFYKKFFLSVEEEHEMSDGYIYIHDRGSRLDSINCCLFDMKNLLNGGFFMGNLDYNEPKTLAVAFDLIGDVTMNAAACQYGGFSISEIDKLLAPYAKKSYDLYVQEYKDIAGDNFDETKADSYAMAKVKRDYEQGFQAWEMKFNSVASSRGDYPFTSVTFGLGKDRFETLASSTCLSVRKNGQGKEGKKHPVLFPKLSFFYDENLHGEGKELEWLFDEAIDCSSKAMYPDYISCTGDGYAANIYKKYGKTISKMGCIDYNETIKVSNDKEHFVTMKIGDLYKELINPTPDSKFTVINSWIEGFRNYKLRKPTLIELNNHFKTNYKPIDIIKSADIHKSDINLWESYSELLISDFLFEGIGFIEITNENQIEDYRDEDGDYHGFQCNGFFMRNRVWNFTNDKDDTVISKKLPFYFPQLKLGIDIIKSNVGKQNYNEKIAYFSNIGIKVITIDEKDILDETKELKNVLPQELYGSTEPWGYLDRTFANNIRRCSSTGEKIDLDSNILNYYVQDIDGTFVHIKNIIKNFNINDWLIITLNNGKTINVTSDHPLITKAGQMLACDLIVGDVLFDEDFEELIITDIKCENVVKDSYDVETESGTFIFSGIQSHNCRATLSPWFVKGGIDPLDETDYPVYEGRFNLGAISLHFPMIAAKAQHDGKDFYEVLEYYLEMVRKIHKRTFNYLSHIKAGTNPLGFCQGGFLNGYKDPEEELGEEFLRPMTLSFGITALNETSVLMTGKSIREDNTFAIEVLKYINDYVNRIKHEDNLLYAIYGTPAESLCGLQIKQFRNKYGIIKGVSDREYTSNSFHCGVWEDITPVEKQDIEHPMFHLSNGGAIQYCRYPISYNTLSFKTLIRRAMKLGFYEGVNLNLSTCEECGHQFTSEDDKCPKCGSDKLITIVRMNGYLGYSRIKGKTMYSDHKMAEFKDRVSM